MLFCHPFLIQQFSMRIFCRVAPVDPAARAHPKSVNIGVTDASGLFPEPDMRSIISPWMVKLLPVEVKAFMRAE
jgi:hypothetical protein